MTVKYLRRTLQNFTRRFKAKDSLFMSEKSFEFARLGGHSGFRVQFHCKEFKEHNLTISLRAFLREHPRRRRGSGSSAGSPLRERSRSTAPCTSATVRPCLLDSREVFHRIARCFSRVFRLSVSSSPRCCQ